MSQHPDETQGTKPSLTPSPDFLTEGSHPVTPSNILGFDPLKTKMNDAGNTDLR